MTKRPYTHLEAVQFVKIRFTKSKPLAKLDLDKYENDAQLRDKILRGSLNKESVVIDVYDKIGLNADGTIKSDLLGGIVMRYLALTQQQVQQKHLIFTNFHMLVAFEKYLKNRHWATPEVNVGIIYYPVFSNESGKISKECTDTELSYAGIIGGLKAGFLRFNRLDKEIQNHISYILKNENRLPRKRRSEKD